MQISQGSNHFTNKLRLIARPLSAGHGHIRRIRLQQQMLQWNICHGLPGFLSPRIGNGATDA
tara:strand:+ start:1386 stop:1571 length:186 start_codon:yes stop_codon:yes gene_type:complete